MRPFSAPTVPSPSPVLLQAGACLNWWPADKGGGQEHPSRCKSEGTAPAPSKADTEAHHWPRLHDPTQPDALRQRWPGGLLACWCWRWRCYPRRWQGHRPGPGPDQAALCGVDLVRLLVATAASLRPDGNGLEFKSSLTRCPLLLRPCWVACLLSKTRG